MIIYFLDKYAVVGGRSHVVQPVQGCSSNWLIFCVDLVLDFLSIGVDFVLLFL